MRDSYLKHAPETIKKRKVISPDRISEAKVDSLTESYGTVSYAFKYRESLISAVSAGFFLILIGALFILTPGLLGKTIEFIQNFGLVNVPNTTISFFAPTSPLAHRVVYMAAEQFCFAFGVFHVVILALRFAARSSIGKKTDTVGNMIFWIGAGYLVRTLLLEKMLSQVIPRDVRTTWFIFWAALITLIGVTLIVRAIILAATMPRRVA